MFKKKLEIVKLDKKNKKILLKENASSFYDFFKKHEAEFMDED